MGDAFKKVKNGDDLLMSSRAYNSFIGNSNALSARSINKTSPRTILTPQASVVMAKNDSGVDQDRFSILGIEAPPILPSVNVLDFVNKKTFSGIAPLEADHIGRIMITQKGIRAGDMGPAIVSGATPCRLRMTDPAADVRFAEIIDGDSTALKPATSGSIAVLWHVAAATGDEWCIVNLGGGGGAGGGAITIKITNGTHPYEGIEVDKDGTELGDTITDIYNMTGDTTAFTVGDLMEMRVDGSGYNVVRPYSFVEP